MHGRDILLGVLSLASVSDCGRKVDESVTGLHMELTQYFGKPEVAVRSVKL
jgi:hypothetical protein